MPDGDPRIDRVTAPSPDRWRAVVLLGGGLGLVGVSLALAGAGNLVAVPRTFLGLFAIAFACYGAGLWALARHPDGCQVLIVVTVAVLCRLALLLGAPPSLSTDAYRYVWDARVAAAGLSPYALAPTDAAVAHLRDDAISPHLNHPTWRTIYPPGAQAFFRLVYALRPDSVLAMKVAVGLADLATLIVLASLLRALGVRLARLAVYAWNPLVLVEVWGSAHLDALAVLAAVVAVRLAIGTTGDLVTAGRAASVGINAAAVTLGGVRMHAAAGVLALGTLVKLYPGALLPLLLARGRPGLVITFAVVVVAGYLPFARLGLEALGSLPQYLAAEYFNLGLLRSVIDVPVLGTAALAAWVLYAGFARRDTPLIERTILLIGGGVLLSPNVFPWYVLWLVPFLALRPSAPWIAFTGTVALAYTFFLTEPWSIPAWARVAEFAPLAAGAAWALARRLVANRNVAATCLISPPVRGGPP